MQRIATILILDYACKKPQANRGYAEGLRRLSEKRRKHMFRSRRNFDDSQP